MRSFRFSVVQSSTGIGGNTATSTVPGLNVLELRSAMTSALRMTIGTIGMPVAIAIRNGPFLNSADLGGVQPGALGGDQDRKALAGKLFHLVQALDGRLGIVAVDERRVHHLADGARSIGSFSSSFLPTEVKLSLTSRPAMNGSDLLRWLKMNTAGRCGGQVLLAVDVSSMPMAVISSAAPRRGEEVDAGAPVAGQQAQADGARGDRHQRGDARGRAQLRHRDCCRRGC